MNQERQHRFLDLPTGGMVMAFIHSFHSLFCCGFEPLAQIGFGVQRAKKDFESFYNQSEPGRNPLFKKKLPSVD
jgi:hypothetical protein